jgi:diphthine synthase
MSMGELLFVGLGLGGVDDMSVRALKELKDCDQIFVEFYTSRLIDASLEDLGAAVGKDITVLKREDVEESEMVVDAARNKKVAFVTAGDTMAATTHVDLRIQAVDAGIMTKVIHGVSIFSACPSSLGLQPYKFGRTVTLPFVEGEYFPSSPYERILENKERGLHTLVLLDIREEEKRYMTSTDGVNWLMEAEKRWARGLITPDSLICAAARIGSSTERIAAGYPEKMRSLDMGGPLHTLVVPSKLHFMEAYALVKFADAPREIAEGE